MTPAVLDLQRRKLSFSLHEYDHDPRNPSYGLEAAEALNQAPERIFKTLVVADQADNLAVAVVPVDGELDLKAMARALSTKKVQLAKPEKVERTTGYVLGGVSPFGQKRSLPTFVDQSASDFATMFVSGGRRGLEIEIAPSDLITVTKGRYESLGIKR